MHSRTRRLAALVGAAALALPAAAIAKDRDERHHRDKAKKVKLDTFVFKGVYQGDGAVNVVKGNSRVRRSGFYGQVVTFDLTTARISVADVNGDGQANAADLTAGDKVVVKARLPRRLKAEGAGTLKASKVVDQTHPRSEEDDDACKTDKKHGKREAAAS